MVEFLPDQLLCFDGKNSYKSKRGYYQEKNFPIFTSISRPIAVEQNNNVEENNDGKEEKEEEEKTNEKIDEKSNQKPQNGDNDSITCIICFDKPKDTLFLDCKHLCACNDCALLIIKSNPVCPLCKANIVSSIKVFL